MPTTEPTIVTITLSPSLNTLSVQRALQHSLSCRIKTAVLTFLFIAQTSKHRLANYIKNKCRIYLHLFGDEKSIIS